MIVVLFLCRPFTGFRGKINTQVGFLTLKVSLVDNLTVALLANYKLLKICFDQGTILGKTIVN